MTSSIPLSAQLINLFAAVILLLGFAMLAQRRMLSLVNLFALQGFACSWRRWWPPSPPGRSICSTPPA
jgi:hypothetical protein